MIVSNSSSDRTERAVNQLKTRVKIAQTKYMICLYPRQQA